MAMVTAMAGSGLMASSPLKKPSLGFGIKGLSGSRYMPARIRVLNSVQEKVPSSASLSSQDAITVGGTALAGAVFAAMASSDSALAAQQVMELAAAGDNRGAAILLPLVPAIGWVLFNILQPALNQINKMRSAKGLAVGLGLGALASIVASPQASAATQELAAIADADNDSRGLLLLGVLVPAVGWVLFNILRPALNQIDKMKASKGIIAGGFGFGALSMLYTPHADAADEVLALAASTDNDSRGLLLLIVILPAIGWVLFNILRPALNQIDKMRSK